MNTARAAATALVLASAAWAGDDAKTPVDWREQAKAEGLTTEEIERLASTKLLVAGPEYRQIFQPYDSSRVPTFVTADSVLNAYHVIFEESVVRLERARAARLPDVLRPMWDGIPSAAANLGVADAQVADAKRRAQVLVGTALRLLGDETPGASEEVASLIDAESALVVAHQAKSRSSWLGPPDDGFPFLDYGRFEPRGFYVRDERLSAYFRATAWLQAVPLRAHRRPEILTALILAETLQPHRGPPRPDSYRTFVGQWRSFLGSRGDPALPDHYGRPDGPWIDAAIDDFDSTCARRWFDGLDVEPARAPRREDLDSPRVDPLHGREPGVRVLPAITLPDGDLFDACCPPSPTPRYPTGLFVAAALGGDFAQREALRGRDATEAGPLEAAFAQARRSWSDERPPTDPLSELPGRDDPPGRSSLYSAYLDCIGALLDPAEPDAPALFASDAWKMKSTNAALAGWAQLRHTWTLQARESADYAGLESTVAGFVEPDPTFFARLGDLVGASLDLFEKSGAFDDATTRREFADDLRHYAARLRGPDGDALWTDIRGHDDGRCLHPAWFVQENGGSRVASYAGSPRNGTKTGDLAVLDEAVRILAGPGPPPEKCAEALRWMTPPLAETWRALERLVRRLESMSQKELRGIEWNEGERALLLDFGHVLAAAMFYGGNSYESPRDDAPRATSVYAWLGDPKSAGYFQVGIARPRALYVLYPSKGREVLCRGAVMPYREFVRDKRLTDDEWRALLDSKDAPPAPDWMTPITAPVRAAPK